MVLEQAALTHDIERIFRSKKSEKTFQNDEGAKQHMAPSTSQVAWTFVRVALSNRSKIDGRKDTPNFFISIGVGLDVVAHLTSSSPAVRNSMRWAEDKAILRWEDIPDSGTDPQRG